MDVDFAFQLLLKSGIIFKIFFFDQFRGTPIRSFVHCTETPLAQFVN